MRSVRAPLILLVVFAAAKALAADYPLSTPPIGPTPRACGYSTVAKLGDLFLAVWSEGNGLRATRLDRNGKPVDPQSFAIASLADPYGFYVATSGSNAIVCWREGYSKPFHLARIDRDAVVTPLSISLPANVYGLAANEQNILLLTLNLNPRDGTGTAAATLLDHDGTLVRADVPFAISAGRLNQISLNASEDGFLVAYTVGDFFEEVRIVRLTASGIRNGSIPPDDQMVARNRTVQSSARVAANGAHVVAAWSDGGTAYVMPVSATGTTAAGTPLYVGAFNYVTSVIPFGDGFLATFFELPPGGVYNIVVARISATGELVSLARTPWGSSGSIITSVAASGSSAMVVWIRAQLVAAAPVDDSGTIGSRTVVSLSPANNQRVQALFATPSGAFAVWTEAGPAERVVVGRIDANGKPVDGPGLRVRDSDQNQVGVAAAFDGRKALIVWVEQQSSSPEAAYGAIVDTNTLTVERVFPVNGNVTTFGLAAAWNGSEFVVVWNRRPQFDLAAVRVSRAGELIDIVPSVLTPPRPRDYVFDGLPRISWNGTEYLLVWQRQRYFNLAPYIPECVCVIVGELFAQRVTRQLFPDGAAIALSDHPDFNGRSAQGFDVASTNGTWLVAWSEYDAATYSGFSTFARIDSSGTRLDPLNGRPIADLDPLETKHIVATQGSWRVASGRRDVAITMNGAAALPTILSLWTIDALTDGPIPMVAYSAVSEGELRAYVHIVPSRRRAVR
jgi:hypothetical protein